MGTALLERAGERLATAKRLATVQEIVRTTARAVVEADGATFVLRDVDHCFYLDEDAISPLWKGQRFPIANCVSGWAMTHAESVVIGDIAEDPRVPLDAYRPTFVKSMAMVPVGVEKPIAAIGVYWARLHAASPEEIGALEVLAASAGRALDRIGLFEAPVLPVLDDAGTARREDLVDRGPIRIIVGEEHERIARDLHDTVLQRIFGTGLALRAALGLLEPASPAAERVGEAIGEIDESIRELRGVIFGLHQGQPEFGGLSLEILAAAAEATRSLGFKPEVRISASEVEVDDVVRRETVAALRELFSNVTRHAQATSVLVDLEVVPESALTLRVVDDGVGVPDRPTRGNGLGNLGARAEDLGGTFEIARGEVGGTRVTWSVPLE